MLYHSVTGGCSGLGLAVAEDLIKRDGLVCVMDMDEARGLELVEQHRGRLSFQRCDVRSELDVKAGLQKAAQTWPDCLIGGLVHCAGVAGVGKTIDSKGDPGDLEIFKTVVDINLNGSFNVARLVASQMVKLNSTTEVGKTVPTEERGVIILTSSSSYQDGQVGQAAYASSKGGVASLVLPMARDLARFGIRVNAIAPSLFETKMGQGISPTLKKNLLNAVEYPIRFGDPREFSSLVIECIHNGYLNGTVIRIDAGSRMGKL